MLRTILNISWKEHLTKIRLYGKTRFAGHYYQSEEEIIRDVLLWTPNHGTTKPGRQKKLM